MGADEDAEQIGGDESELGGLDANDANDHAIDTCHEPAFPAPTSDENGRNNG